jgi:hypothetical protein
MLSMQRCVFDLCGIMTALEAIVLAAEVDTLRPG